ncbi:DUF6473 family protein [Yoonia sp. 2307UL14-13]|uniref:DUF6473 family protein n=1 Tax=Yoonia sp. 2307UL14-13 TaxID=3126506 RepID=UPI0030A0E8EE
MTQDSCEQDRLDYAPCRYGGSRMVFRGPRRRLDQPYLAFIGGTETYGKFLERPYPTMVEHALDRPCINLGCVNGGIDAFVNDPALMEICHDAEMTVVQVMGANYLSNRFYSVHPRRNDRFVQASSVLQAIYGDVDFSDFTFVRHMLGDLHTTSPKRFETVVGEVREAWTARMKNMLGQIGTRSILMWFSEEEVSDRHWSDRHAQLQVDPLFITKSMLNELRPMVQDIVIVNPSRAALATGTAGMTFLPDQENAASELMGVACHEEAADAIIATVQTMMRQVA